jgi:hypothetical protein
MAFFFAGGLSAVVSALAAIGPALSSFSTSVLPALSPYLSKGLTSLQTAGRVAEGVFQAMGILQPGEKLAEIGLRALQGAREGILPNHFDSFASYMGKLRELQLDPEQKIDPVTQVLAGLALASRGLDERLTVPEGSSALLWPLVLAAPDYFSAEKIVAIVQMGQNLLDVIDYFRGRLPPAESLDVEDHLLELDKLQHPEQSEEDLRENLYAQQDKIQHPHP